MPGDDRTGHLAYMATKTFKRKCANILLPIEIAYYYLKATRDLRSDKLEKSSLDGFIFNSEQK